MKYYAVKRGRETGIYDNWAECKAQVDGFNGPVFKSFPTREGAEAFMKGRVPKRRVDAVFTSGSSAPEVVKTMSRENEYKIERCLKSVMRKDW